jgi:hypothetical protein
MYYFQIQKLVESWYKVIMNKAMPENKLNNIDEVAILFCKWNLMKVRVN